MNNTLPIIFPKAQTACSQTFWCGDDKSLKNKGTAPAKKRDNSMNDFT